MAKLQLAQNKDADALISIDALMLLVGMVLDQQITIEKAFTSPLVLTERLGHTPDAAELADFDPDKLSEIFSTPPALHRFPGSMAKRVQQMCQVLMDDFGGKPENVWKNAKDGKELLANVSKLPGFGEQKAKIFVALLGKQLGVQPSGWREAAGNYGKDGSQLSVADIVDADSLGAVRESKRKAKAAAKAKK